jgi:hypothetical protein
VIPRNRARRQRRHPEVRIALLLLTLMLALSPAIDRAAEARGLDGDSQPARALDLCSVPGLVLVPVAPRPAELASPLTDLLTLLFPSPVARVTDHPPRPA